MAIYPSGKFYRSVNGGDFEQIDPEPNALCFDKNDLCTFTMCFTIPEGGKLSYDLMSYCPGKDKYAQKTDSGFDIPFEELKKIIKD